MYGLANLLLPSFSMLIINQEWSFLIPFLDLEYKPWRLFMVICEVLNLICALCLQFVLCESPKYTYSRGDEEATLKILRQVFKMNTGKSALEYEVKQIKKNEEFGSNSESSSNFLKAFWDQSIPLFRGKHLRNILTACFLQFAMCNTANGFRTFLPEIIDKVLVFVESDSSESATICQILSQFKNDNSTGSESETCVEKLATGTFVFLYLVTGINTFFYFIISFTINWGGKLWNLEIVLLVSGLSAIGIIFIKSPIISSVFILILLLVGLGIVVVNSSTIELFPTKMR